jgi:small subunit ribosomal protein MRP21
MELSQAAARVLMRCRPTLLYTSQVYRPQATPLTLRTFTTTRLLRQDQSDAFARQFDSLHKGNQPNDTSAATTSGEDNAQSAPPASAPTPAQQSQTRNETPSMMDLMDSVIDGTKGVPTAAGQRTSRFVSSGAQDNTRVKPASAPNSADDFVTNLRSIRTNALSAIYKPEARPIRELEFTPGPSLGKTVQVRNGGDVGRAFRQVEALCARNRVRTDVARQRFHERPGLKRKRLHSERWRRRFKEAFRGTVKMVNKMRKQGW